MDKTLLKLKDELSALADAVNSNIPSDEALNVAHSNWSFPGIAKADLVWYASELAEFIDNNARDAKQEGEFGYYDIFLKRLSFLRTHTVPQLWNNSGNAVPAYLSTLGLLKKALNFTFGSKENPEEISKKLKRLAAQTRGMESRAKDIEPRIGQLNEMLKSIESVHEAAESFPEDIESLKDSRNKIERITAEAEKDRVQIAIKRESLEEAEKSIINIKMQAEEALKKCEEAYRASTSQGLASAFLERSKNLSISMWFWVAGLAGALSVGGHFGADQIAKLSGSIQSDQTGVEVVVFNALMSLLSVGAPIWFAWISTKQINQRFRLAEDYAFKASISRAYEGYRSEAARLDKKLELSLLSSALNRLDEIPLRLVETTSHGSPLHELLTTESIKRAFGTVPGFAGKVARLADDSLSRLAGNATKSTVKHDRADE